MLTLKCNQPVYFDVDDTLIMWNWPHNMENVEQIITLDPWNDGKLVELVVNSAMLDQMLKHKVRGHTIVVWSQGGWEWAETVVKALKLEHVVDLVVEKPMWMYDDLEAQHFMPKAKWIGRKEWLIK